ncbi:MAG: mandelate racemase [Acidiferrobacteraceae bacterium]|nr:mandelate racemase [Acidiferrobacteraceae bacterium]|tara:strand:+ start:9754 stop:10857 length:1104 start_codon:yes stop_codon:yes gene_type:complete
MKIESIAVYQIDLPLVEGRYSWADGKFVEKFDSTIVEIRTDQEAVGLGEVCPLGPFYLPAFGTGARAGIEEIAPGLIGLVPTEIMKIKRHMDSALLGHPYVKSCIDMACWDLLGKETGKPLWALLGGKFGDSIQLYRAISQESPNEMAHKVAKYREEGYQKFQLKVGSSPEEDIERIHTVRSLLDRDEVLVADANTGWTAPEALRVANAVSSLDIFIEQPCASYQKCVSVRDRISTPFILDETIDGLEILLRAHNDRAMDVINLKISKVGGITVACQIRDLCVSLGIPMTIEDSWGGDIITAAIAHLAHSTPEEFRFSSTDFNSYSPISNAFGAPVRDNGMMTASDKPGLGVTLNKDIVGEPVAIYS